MFAPITFEFTNLQEVIRRLDLIPPAVEQDLAASLFEDAEGIMGESKKEVPVDTGALRSTGFVDLPEISNGRIEITLGYGGPAVGYAVFVHEHHKTKAKYLERPFFAATDEMEQNSIAALQRAIDRVMR